MKRTLALLLCLLMALSIAPAVSAEGEAADLVTIKVMGYERGLEGTKFADREEYPVWQKAKELFAQNGLNLEFEIIADQDQYKTTIQTRLASNYNLPDMCYVGTMTDTDVLDMADQGILLPMNDVLATTKGYAYDYFYGGEGDTARNIITDEKGNFYWLPRIQMNQLDGVQSGTSMGMCIRLDWLDELGLPVPQTIDEFTAALQAFQDNDMNKNGLKDEVLDADTSRFENGIHLWYGMVTDYVGVNITDKKVESPWYSPYAQDYFAYVKSLNDKGLLYADAIGSDASRDQVRNENRLAGGYYYPIGSYWENPLIAAGVEKAYYIGITPFAAVEGAKPFYSEETPYLVYLKHAVTNAAADKLDSVAKVYDTIYSPEYLHLMDWGVLDVTYKVEDGKNVSITRSKSFKQNAEDRTSMVDYLWRCFLPNLFHNERLNELGANAANGWQKKVDFELAVNDYPNKTPNDNSGYYALPTTEQAARLAELLPDLETYSRELAANLTLGRASLDNWDEYMSEFKELGLDEVIAIRQDQLDRRYGN